MMNYLLQVSLCWMGFYAIYALLLSKETFFGLNRWYLLATALLGLVIPAVELDWFFGQPAELAVYYLQPVTVGFGKLETAIVTASPQEDTTLSTLLKWVYWLGVGVCSCRFVYGFFQLGSFYKKGEITRQNGYNLISTDLPHAPFSFFKNLFWSRKFEVSEEEKQNIYRHEEAHISQWHSLDVLLLEVLSVVFWFCPFIYFYKKSMKAVHEYLADAYVLQTAKKKQYAQLLLRQSLSGPHIALMNSLFNSQLKKRIVMMTKNKSSRRAAWKYLAMLPLLAILCLAFSFSEKVPPQLTSSYEAVTDTIPPEEEIFKVVEELPRFPGCEELNGQERKSCTDKKMLEFIYQNIKYPKEAREKGTEGMVVIKFIIEKNGSITSPEIVRAIGGGCDEEVLRIVQEMPNWIPGKQRGRNVRVQFNLPVKFKLDSDNAKSPSGTNEEKVVEGFRMDNVEAKSPSGSDEVKVVQGFKLDNSETKPAGTSSVKNKAMAMPLFAGCEDGKCSQEKLYQFIAENMKYPADAKKAGIEGTVHVKFSIGKDGVVSNAEVIKGIFKSCDAEALRVVNAMPAWTNESDNEVPLVLPFAFKMNENDKTIPNKSGQLAVYPNPAKDRVTVEFRALPGTVMLTLVDVSGREVFKQTFTGYDGFGKKVSGIDISKAAKGNLVITLSDGKGNYLNSVQVVVQ